MDEIISLKDLQNSNLLKKGSWIQREIRRERRYEILNSSGCNIKQAFCIERDVKILGRYMREENDIIEIAGKTTEFEVYFKGLTGFVNGTRELNQLCGRLYSEPEYGIISTCINEEQYDFLSKQQNGTIFEEIDKTYWLAERAVSRMGLGLGMKYVLRGIKEIYYFYDLSTEIEKQKVPYVKNVCPWHFVPINNPRVRVAVGDKYDGKTEKTAFRIVYQN